MKAARALVLACLFVTTSSFADVGWSILNFRMTTQVASGGPADADYSCIQARHELSIYRHLSFVPIDSQVGTLRKNGAVWSWTSYYVNYIWGVLPLVPEGYQWKWTIAVPQPDGTFRVLGSGYQNGVLGYEFSGYTSLSSLPDPLPLVNLSQLVPANYDCRTVLAQQQIDQQMQIGNCYCNVYCQYCNIWVYNNRPQNAVGFSRAACENPRTSPAMQDMANQVCAAAGCWGTSTTEWCRDFSPTATPSPTPVAAVAPP